MDKSFADWLIQEMNDRGMSQSDLARAANISRQAVSDYVNQRRINPDPEPLVAIAKALQLSPEIVFRKAGLLPPKPEDDEKQDILDHLFASLPPDGQEEVLAYLRFKVDQFETEKKKKLHPRLST